MEIEKARQYFLVTTKNNDQTDKWHLHTHVPQVESWARRFAQKFSKVDLNVLLLAVWLHDIGHYVGEYGTYDHAEKSQELAREYLEKEGVRKEVIDRVAHAVRAHRCRDVQPITIEAKILAASDSASHLTDWMYIDMYQHGKLEAAKEKLERDYRDLSLLPGVQAGLTPIYQAWKKLLAGFEKIA